MFKKIKNKKGEDLLVDFWAILIFTIVLLIFLLIIILNKDPLKTKNLQQNFINSDLDYMLNSYLKAPSLINRDKTNAEVIVEDYLNNDYSNTQKSFEIFFLGINTTNNNPVGEYKLIISESNFVIQKISVDPISTGYTLDKLFRGKYVYENYAKTKIPSINNDLDILLYTEYVIMNDKPFE
ncbi:MAG: hypothetical protein QXK76_00820 [Candidatus Woesearchaeota archaeon]